MPAVRSESGPASALALNWFILHCIPNTVVSIVKQIGLRITQAAMVRHSVEDHGYEECQPSIIPLESISLHSQCGNRVCD
jgi:hypothetical protein